MPITDPRAQGLVPCAACGRRPGTVEVVYNSPRGPVNRALCDRCARELMAASGNAPQPSSQPAAEQSSTPALDTFGRDLTAEATAGRIDHVIGRGAEIEQTIEILARRRKNNAVLIGEAGVGKTA